MSEGEGVGELSSEPKKAKLDSESPGKEAVPASDCCENENRVDTGTFPFHKFNFEVLYSDPVRKVVTLSGKLEDDTDEFGVLVAEKVPLTQQSVAKLFANARTKKTLQNDIYSQYKLDSNDGGAGEVKVITVFPATQKHLEKYGPQNKRMVLETPEIYEKITKPCVLTQAMPLEWVYNILDGKAEQDRVVFEDPHPETGFVLVPDLKWDGEALDSLYLLAIVRWRGILSVRDLRPEHCPMIRNVLDKGKREISRKYGIEGNQIRVYFHYQPTFYHLHAHFTHLKYHTPKSSQGEGHLLDDVLDNIENIDPLYYAKKTLCFSIKESTALWKEYSKVL